jgi:hypothetical protein
MEHPMNESKVVTQAELDTGVKQIAIDDAEASQLREFGKRVLGLELVGNETKAIMKGKFAEVGYNLAFIRLESAPNGIPTMQPRGINEAFNTEINSKGEKTVRIQIHAQDKPGGDEPVPVGVNGKLIWIPRNKPVFVPEAYVEVLSHAEEFIYAEYNPDANNGLGGLPVPRTVKSYPFSFA